MSNQPISNAAQAKHWNEIGGPQWVAGERVHDQMLEPFQRPLLNALAPRLGETILDVGCGYGTTSIAVASVLGWNGRVHGVDISSPMIERARARVAGSPLNLSFGVMDAQTAVLPGPYDAVVSRFGVMFFDDPVAAFANIGAATRPGGRLAFVCWQPPARNPYFSMVAKFLVPLLAAPPVSLPPEAPGPFAFQDPDRTRGLVADGGWIDVEIAPFEPMLRFGTGAGTDRGVETIIELAMASEVGRKAADQATPTALAEALDRARAELSGHVDADGALRIPAATWIVTARRPT